VRIGILLFCGLCLVPAGAPGQASPPLVSADITALPEGCERLDLYLLIGQSNMVGLGALPALVQNNPDVVMMRYTRPEDSPADEGWYVARHPLHEGANNAGAGPGLTFAGAMREADPEARVGLIPAAVGGSRIAQWAAAGKNYQNAVRRAKAALAAGPPGRTRLGAVLWLQGEADTDETRAAVYPAALHDLVDRLRAEFGDADLPFIVCTIGERGTGDKLRLQGVINAALLALPQHRARTACVDARDLQGFIDAVHYNTATSEEIGRRYAAALGGLEAPAMRFTEWLQRYGLSGEAAQPEAAPASDGIANLLKYAFNLDPLRHEGTGQFPGGSRGLPYLTPATTGFLEMIYYRDPSKSDIRLVPVWNTQLDEASGWIEVSDRQILDTQDGIETWSARIPMDQGPGFMRMEVELAE
jgi:hypothetical protein